MTEYKTLDEIINSLKTLKSKHPEYGTETGIYGQLDRAGDVPYAMIYVMLNEPGKGEYSFSIERFIIDTATKQVAGAKGRAWIECKMMMNDILKAEDRDINIERKRIGKTERQLINIDLDEPTFHTKWSIARDTCFK